MKRLSLIITVYVGALVAFGQSNGPPAAPSTDTHFVADINALMNLLSSLPSHIVVGLTCIVLGYCLRTFKRFPNDAIPVVCVCWGMLFNPLMADPHMPGSSVRVWFVKNVLFGFLVGAGSWLLHRYFLSRFEARIPVIGDLLENADKASDQYQADKLAAKGVVVNVSVGSSGTH